MHEQTGFPAGERGAAARPDPRPSAYDEQGKMKTKSNFGAWVLIAIGTYFLLQKFGLFPRLGPLIAQWWPLILIVIGVAMLVRGPDRKEP
jgi:hypothetical protein